MKSHPVTTVLVSVFTVFAFVTFIAGNLDWLHAQTDAGVGARATAVVFIVFLVIVNGLINGLNEDKE